MFCKSRVRRFDNVFIGAAARRAVTKSCREISPDPPDAKFDQGLRDALGRTVGLFPTIEIAERNVFGRRPLDPNFLKARYVDRV